MSKAQEIQIEKLFIDDSAYSKTFTDIFVTSATSIERSFQTLIILIDYPRVPYGNPGVSDAMVRHATKVFEASRHATPELVLESVLESLNIFLPEVLPRKSKEWLESLNLLIAISDRGQIHFSQVGRVRAFLIQENTISLVSEKQETVNPLKIFSHITSGLLDPGHAMVFTTLPLIDYIAEEKIKRLLAEFPPQVVVRQIERILSQVPPQVTFAAVLIKFTTELDELASKPVVTTPRTLPVGIEAAPAEQPVMLDAIENEPMPYRMRTRRRGNAGNMLTSALGGFGTSLGYYLLLLYRVIGALIMFIVRTIRTAVVGTDRRKEEDHFIRVTQQAVSNAWQKFSRLPRAKKISFVIVLIVSFVLIHTLVIRSQEQQVKKIANLFNETLLTVSERKKAAENSLVYKNEKEAEKIYLEIRGLLAGISPLNKEQEEQLASYRDENERNVNKILHINYISSPLTYADLQSVSEGILGIASTRDGGIIAHTKNNLYRIKEGKAEFITKTPGTVRFAPHDGDTLYLIGDGKVAALVASELQPITVASAAKLESADAVALYARNLYALHKGEGAIFKYEGTSTALKKESIWITNPELVARATHLAVDGNIYVTTSDGAIVKLSRGEQQNFSYHEFNPKLGSQTKIYTSKDSNLLYILDRDTKRIIILDKQGNIRDQYTSPRFDDLIDLTVSINEDSLTVLNGKYLFLLAVNK